jgi:hypothetical protein
MTVSQIDQMSAKGSADRFLDVVATACKGRKIFTTPFGELGIGPAGMQDGDLACVLYGATVPSILRRQKQSFNLKGECYVLSLM